MNRINELLKSNRTLFHTQDLAVIWKINNPSTLYTAINRYTNKGILTRLHKGFYTTAHPSDLDPIEVGTAASQTYAYLSTESVLVRAGLFPQIIYWHTFISSKSYRVTINQFNFSYRQLADQFLYNETGVTRHNNVFIASTERAVADLLYFVPTYYLDAHEFIDWEKVKQIQKQIGYI